MSLFFLEYYKIFFFFSFACVLSLIIILLSYFFSSFDSDLEKVSAYECGFNPYEDARHVFDIRFYLVAILFIVFDLEALYFFPFCISFSFLSLEAFWGMIDFLLELFVGFIYAYMIGVFEWENTDLIVPAFKK